jgi:hypothetical protein
MLEKSSPSFLSSRGGGAFNTRNVELVRELGDEAVGGNIHLSFLGLVHFNSLYPISFVLDLCESSMRVISVLPCALLD